MKRIIFSLGTITLVAIFTVASISIAEDKSSSEGMVQCAFDGMKGPKSSMKAQMEYQGKTYYFCTQEERDKFAQEPEKYLKMRTGMHQETPGGMHEGMEGQGEHHQDHGSVMEGMGMGHGSGHGGMHGGSGHR
jgi:YHS domain-containing protein